MIIMEFHTHTLVSRRIVHLNLKMEIINFTDSYVCEMWVVGDISAWGDSCVRV